MKKLHDKIGIICVLASWPSSVSSMRPNATHSNNKQEATTKCHESKTAPEHQRRSEVQQSANIL